VFALLSPSLRAAQVGVGVAHRLRWKRGLLLAVAGAQRTLGGPLALQQRRELVPLALGGGVRLAFLRQLPGQLLSAHLVALAPAQPGGQALALDLGVAQGLLAGAHLAAQLVALLL
jgi:hypothetical protein